MDVEKERLIFIEPWSDSVCLLMEKWRIFTFIPWFLSKGNAFNENFIRTKFILRKIFFRMSILSSSKTLWMFFNLHFKMTLLDFQLIIIITVSIQVAVLNQFSWNSHGFCKSINGWTLSFFLETIEALIFKTCNVPIFQ